MYSSPECLLKMPGKRSFQAAALTLFLCATSYAQLPQVDERPAQHALKRFMQLCVSGLADRKKVEEVAPQLGFQRLQAQAAAGFVGNADASVWVEQNEFGQFAIGAAEGGICSVFMRRAHVASLTSAFKTWLPPRESEFEAEPLPVFYNRNQTTLSYGIKRKGEPFAVWSLTTTPLENTVYQGVISMRKL